jgi:predicted AAA+ superfamily ATPase
MDAHPLYHRFVADQVIRALEDTPVVLINGPRQCGKTTLVQSLAADTRAYVSLDDDTVLDAALNDPVGFVRGFDRATIDEVQRAPDLLRAIKRSVDLDRRPGRYLLTGSANVLTLPTVADSLAGRLEILSLMPLSRAEIRHKRPAFLSKALSGAIVKPSEKQIGDELVHTVLTGGYPEMLRRTDPGRRRAWARDYVRAIVHRDVRDVADVERLDQMPRLLQVLAHHAGQLTNFTQIGAHNGLDDKTTKKYLAILEQLFVVSRLEPWFRNRLKRLVKTPKLHFLDSGLLAATLGISMERIAGNRTLFGPLLETFVFGEIVKQTTWLDEVCTLTHYRDKDQDEVDIVIEHESGDLVGVEVKAAATVTTADFKGLRKLAAATGDDLTLGVVLYDGESIVPFGERLFAAPVSCLWG